MLEPFKKVGSLLIATFIVWFTVLAVRFIDAGAVANTAAVIVALISTMTIWTMWALDEYGISMDGQPREKTKRETNSAEDPRLALLLSLFTPDERSALRSRLANELNEEGESVSLADLLAGQDQDTLRTGRSS